MRKAQGAQNPVWRPRDCEFDSDVNRKCEKQS